MKLYYHPASTTCRMVQMLAAEEGIALDYQLVDLFTGEHTKDDYARINPSRLVPALEDGDFRLTESAAILRYLAEKTGSPAYPADLRARSRVNELMDWFNSNLYKDIGYGLVYPQLFPHHKRRSDEAHAGAIDWGKQRTAAWLEILDKNLIGPGKAFLCGDRPTIADYQGAEMICAADIIRCDFSGYPNITRWIRNMKALKSWPAVHEAAMGFAASVKDKAFVTV
jgi:glutathione S-transferase